jgi:hypothetical protein
MTARRMGFAAIIAISLMAFGSGITASGSGLASGEFMRSRIVSNNGLYHLEYQDDGNLVLYAPGDIPYWASNTPGTSVGFTVMQDDGNFVVYDGTGTPIWASGTWGNPGAFLVLNDNGMLSVLSADGSITLWTTDSYIGR